MSLQMKLFAVFLVTALATENEEARYDSYRIHSIIPENTEQLALLQKLESKQLFSFWLEATRVGSPTQIMVAPHQRPLFRDFVRTSNLTDRVIIPDVQKHFDEEKATMMMLQSRRSGTGIDWKNYYSLSDIYTWLKDLSLKHPTAKIVNAGKSYEGRDILGIEITNGAPFPGVIMEAGMHAREWISPAATSWVINEILNSPAQSIYKKFNYLYFPVTNPDGYEYSRNGDRIWRKTRTPYKVDGIFTCYGADPNRNWSFKWMSGGASNKPCDETYAGPAAFSEVETKSLSDFFKSVAIRYDIYLSFHSFSQLIMYPWAYTGDDSPMESTWKRIGTAAAKEMQAVHGTVFKVGSVYDVIYPASGSSIEWYYGTFNSTLTFVFELRDKGNYGFSLPPHQIIPSGEELLPAIRTILVGYKDLKKAKNVTKASSRRGFKASSRNSTRTKKRLL